MSLDLDTIGTDNYDTTPGTKNVEKHTYSYKWEWKVEREEVEVGGPRNILIEVPVS